MSCDALLLRYRLVLGAFTLGLVLSGVTAFPLLHELAWLAYGTDWLAFGHIVIALFFLGPLRDPVANAWVLKTGLVACAGVALLALICGPIRGIPVYWRLIDCSFGVFGAAPLVYCLRLTQKIEHA